MTKIVYECQLGRVVKESRRTFLYIDAGYLRSVVDDFATRLCIPKPQTLEYTHSLTYHPANPLVKGDGWRQLFNPDRVLIYDAPPPERSGENPADYAKRLQNFDTYAQRINSLDGFIVRSGFIRGRGRRARQKGVDIQLAVELLNHAMFGRIDEAVILSGDLDFHPAVETLVRLGTRVTIFAEPKSASKDLLAAVDRTVSLTLSRALLFFPEADYNQYRNHGFTGNFKFPYGFHAESVVRVKLFQFSLLDKMLVTISRETRKKDHQTTYYVEIEDPNKPMSGMLWSNPDLSYLLRYVSVDLDRTDIPLDLSTPQYSPS